MLKKVNLMHLCEHRKRDGLLLKLHCIIILAHTQNVMNPYINMFENMYHDMFKYYQILC